MTVGWGVTTWTLENTGKHSLGFQWQDLPKVVLRNLQGRHTWEGEAPTCISRTLKPLQTCTRMTRPQLEMAEHQMRHSFSNRGQPSARTCNPVSEKPVSHKLLSPKSSPSVSLPNTIALRRLRFLADVVPSSFPILHIKKKHLHLSFSPQSD